MDIIPSTNYFFLCGFFFSQSNNRSKQYVSLTMIISLYPNKSHDIHKKTSHEISP
jgi:hypothetical protein